MTDPIPDDAPYDNALSATPGPRRGQTIAAPFDRPAVTVLVEQNGSRRPVPGRAHAWTADAVFVELDDRGRHYQAWFAAEWVTRR